MDLLLSSSVHETLEELLNQQEFNVYTRLNSDLSTMRNIAQAVGQDDVHLLADMAFLRELLPNTSFDRLMSTPEYHKQ